MPTAKRLNVSTAVDRKVTVIIKTHERPKTVSRLVNSIRVFYPSVQILVADDSRSPRLPKDQDVCYFRLPVDVGLSEGRNFLLDKVETPYLLLCDDDYVFVRQTRIEKLLEVLEKFNVDIVAGDVLENGRRRGWKAFLSVKDRILVVNSAPRGYVGPYPLYDAVPNFFLGDSEKVRRVRWDARLKVAEHTDFFLRAKEQRLACAFCEDVFVMHDGAYPGEWSSDDTRKRGLELKRYWLEGHGIDGRAKLTRSNEPKKTVFSGATGRCGTHFLMGIAYRYLGDWIVRGEQDPHLFGVRDPAAIRRCFRRIAALTRIGEGFIKTSYSFPLFAGEAALEFFREPEFQVYMVHMARCPLETSASFTSAKKAAPGIGSARQQRYFISLDAGRFFMGQTRWTPFQRNLWHWFEIQARIQELRSLLPEGRTFNVPFHRIGESALWESFLDWCGVPQPVSRDDIESLWKNQAARATIVKNQHISQAEDWVSCLSAQEQDRARGLLTNLHAKGLIRSIPDVFR